MYIEVFQFSCENYVFCCPIQDNGRFPITFFYGKFLAIPSHKKMNAKKSVSEERLHSRHRYLRTSVSKACFPP